VLGLAVKITNSRAVVPQKNVQSCALWRQKRTWIDPLFQENNVHTGASDVLLDVVKIFW